MNYVQLCVSISNSRLATQFGQQNNLGIFKNMLIFKFFSFAPAPTPVN